MDADVPDKLSVFTVYDGLVVALKRGGASGCRCSRTSFSVCTIHDISLADVPCQV